MKVLKDRHLRSRTACPSRREGPARSVIKKPANRKKSPGGASGKGKRLGLALGANIGGIICIVKKNVCNLKRSRFTTKVGSKHKKDISTKPLYGALVLV